MVSLDADAFSTRLILVFFFSHLWVTPDFEKENPNEFQKMK